MYIKIVGLSTLFLFLQSHAVAVEVNYNAVASLAHHENINLETNPSEDEWVKSLAFNVSIEENTADINANITASLRAVDYENDLQQDENVGNLLAMALFVITPHVFEWQFSDVYTQSITNPLESDTPDNRQNVNVLSTGPNFYWRMSPRNNLGLEARYQDISFENDLANNTREKAALRWTYDINSTLSVALNYENVDVEFDDQSLGDFSKEDLFASISYRSGRNEYYAEAGVAEIENDIAADLREDRYMVSIESQRTSTSSVRLEARHDVSDTSISILDSTDTFEVADSVLSVASSDIFIRDTIELSYRHAWGVNSMEASLSESESDYREQDNYDAITRDGYLSGTWGISGNSNFTIFARKSNIEYTSLVPYREDDDSSYGLVYRYTPRRHLHIAIEVSAQERDSNIETNNYEDTRTQLSIEYRS